MALADGVVLSDGVVTLRAWRPEDARWYAVAARDPDIQRFTSEPAELSAGDLRAAFASDSPDLAGFAICDATTGERLGNVGLRREAVPGQPAIGEIGYWVAAAARGQGVASRAVRLLSGWAFGSLGLAELRLWTHPDNSASGRVAERAGYRRTPEHDETRVIKGERWLTSAYAIRPSPDAGSAPR